MSRGRVLVVGAGIGGLALTRALDRAGVDSLVVEKAPELRPVGAGITLAAGAVLMLRTLGVELSRVGREVNRLDLGTPSGRRLSSIPMDEVRRRVGPTYALSRHELHQELVRGLPPDRLRLGAEVVAVSDRGPGAEVSFADGSRERFDLVIGADGIHSAVRRALWPDVRPQYSGYTCWRMVVNAPAPEAPIEMWGKGERLGVVPLTAGRVYVFAVSNAPARTAHAPEGMAARLAGRFAHFAWADRLFAAANDDDLIHGDINELVTSEWVRGRVGLIGDAAHASTPNLGFGASLAIEDAWVLAEELSAKGLAAEALTGYFARRYARAAAVQKQSRMAGQVAQWENGLARAARDLALRLTPASRAAASVMKLTCGEPALQQLLPPTRP